VPWATFLKAHWGAIAGKKAYRVIPLGEAHLGELVREDKAHYHEERTHQSLSSRLIAVSTDWL